MPAAAPLALPPELDDDLVALYRSWDLLERPGGNAVIDFDLAPPSGATRAESREAVRNSLESLLTRTAGLDREARELVDARLQASIAFLEAQRGARTPLADYVRGTLGVAPVLFDEEILARQRNRVEELLQTHRPPHDRRALAFSPADFHRFQSALAVHKPGLLPRQFEFYRDKWLPRVRDFLDVPLHLYTVNVSFASEDAYWKNWISGNLAAHVIDLRINIHPRHIWYQGSAEPLVLHEYCGHAVQMISWHQQIEAGRLPRFAGILTVHFPDQFAIEGLAEVMAHVLPDGLPLENKSRLARELHRYSLMVMNNVHIIANDRSEDEAFEYGSGRLPFTKDDVLRREIRERTHDPLNRCYQYVYGIAKERFLGALAELGDRGWSLLETIYRRPMTADQFERLRQQLVSVRA
jgi:hypothetical protein